MQEIILKEDPTNSSFDELPAHTHSLSGDIWIYSLIDKLAMQKIATGPYWKIFEEPLRKGKWKRPELVKINSKFIDVADYELIS